MEILERGKEECLIHLPRCTGDLICQNLLEERCFISDYCAKAKIMNWMNSFSSPDRFMKKNNTTT